MIRCYFSEGYTKVYIYYTCEIHIERKTYIYIYIFSFEGF